MRWWQNIFSRLSFLENTLPKNKRLPLRYWAQKKLLALEPEIEALKELVPKNSNSVDIGANKGIYAIALSRLSDHVYCFEPLEECCEYINNYGSSLISVKNCAISDTPGSLNLHIPIIGMRTMYTRASLENPGDGLQFQIRKVPVSTLDSFNIENLGFIKIDVEGAELAVLTGAEKTLSKYAPNLIVEIDINRHSDQSFLGVFSFLYSLGYHSYVYNQGSFISAVGNEKQLAENYYNFIFQHKAARWNT